MNRSTYAIVRYATATLFVIPLALAVSTAYAVSEARAQTTSRAQERLREARTECVREAERWGYTVERRLGEEYLGNYRYEVRYRLRKGTGRSTYTCYYNARTQSVDIPALSGSDDAAELEGTEDDIFLSEREEAFMRARSECDVLASDLGYTVLSRDRERVLGNDRYQVRMRLLDDGRTQHHYCYYNSRTETVSIPSVPGGNIRAADNTNTGVSHSPALAEQAKTDCVHAARQAEGYRVHRIGEPQLLEDGRYEVALRVSKGLLGFLFHEDIACRHDPNTRAVEFTEPE